MSAVLIVITSVVFPFCIMFTGVVTMIKSRNNETVKGMIVGVIVTFIGGAVLMIVSIILVHELTLYAPYFTHG